jgi:hypothetical protein
MNDKQIYQTASDTLDKLLKEYTPPKEKGTDKKKKKTSEGLDLDVDFKKKLMDAKQTASEDKKVGKIDLNGFRPRRLPKSLKGAAGKLVGKLSGLKGGVAGAAKGAGGLAAAAGGSAGGLAAAAGPLGVALAAIPVLQGIAAETQRAMERDLEETRGERETVAKEVQQLLDSVSNLSTIEDLKDREKAAKEMIDEVRNSEALRLSSPEGMALQRQLAALETNYSPTGMGALKPYSSDAELVAGEFIFILHFFVSCIIFNTRI